MKSTNQSVTKTLAVLRRCYPQKPDMDLGHPDDTLIATILSARTTDAQVLKMWPAFRKRFPTMRSLADADAADIAKSISTIGMYRTKAKSIKGMAKMVLSDFGGTVPKTMEELVTLPGVGRKTASCVLSYAFGIPAIAVDTHVFRISRRLGWAKGKDPEKVETELRALVPKRLWNEINRTMVRFGRDVCVGGTPRCWRCPIAIWCAYTPKTAEPKPR
jgi:endonuclease-3